MDKSAREEWIPTVCYMCYSCCAIQVHKVDGLPVEIRGNPASPNSQGKICAKGKAGIMGLFDPYRIKKPLKRTNPEKGIGVDPGWVEISRQEALEVIVEKLRKVRQDDSRKMALLGLDFNLQKYDRVFLSAFGTPVRITGPAGYYCGPALHLVHYLAEGAFFSEVDLHYCNYCLLVGSQEGFMVNLNANILTQKMAEARQRGMRVVVVDPLGSTAASKADEWIPIRPGTDGALALALLHVLLNELGLFDAEFIKRFTNGSYLIGPPGLYLRDPVSTKPMVWDSSSGRARPFDEVEPRAASLEGKYEAEGVPCQPAFQLLKEFVKDYTPEVVQHITTVDAETIRRLAKEFGQAASIGSSFTMEGFTFPLRPAAVVWKRGAGAHKNGGAAGLALHLINIVVGNIDVPGGILGNRTVTHFAWPKMDADGMLVPEEFGLITLAPYPARKVQRPEASTIINLFPVASSAGNALFEEAMLHKEQYQLKVLPEVALHISGNFMMSTSNPPRVADVFKKIPFMVSFALHMDETVQFADVVLPEAHYLERLVPFPNGTTQGLMVGPGYWYWPLQQPVVGREDSVGLWAETMVELASRLGLAKDFNLIMNNILRFKEPHKLEGEKSYRWDEIADVWAKAWFGSSHDLNWFKEQGLLLSKKRTPQEAYPRLFMEGRIPIYLEHLIKAGEELRQVTEQMGLAWDTFDYQPFPGFRPCPAYHDRKEGCDFFAVNYKLPFHTFSFTAQNPWLNELACRHPSAYRILMNREAAEKKGIKDGEIIYVESSAGRIKGEARLSECVHPEVIGIAGTFGHWAKGLPVAQGKGAHFNSLVPSDIEHIDTLSAALDACVKVRVYRE